jgi:integrase
VDNAREAWLTVEQLRTVCEKVVEQEHGYLVPIVFEAKAGMRLGEVTQLRCRDFVELEGGRSYLTLRRTKNGRVHRFPVSGEVKDFLKRRAAAGRPEDYIFPGPAGGCAVSSILRHFKEAVLAAGLEWGRTRTGITFHSLRRTMASLARNSGMTVEQIQKLGNWKDRRMVEIYALVADETLERAAAELDAVSAGLNRLLAMPKVTAGQRDEGTLRSQSCTVPASPQGLRG